jgi:GNAT superfamily N-acetyltransferase
MRVDLVPEEGYAIMRTVAIRKDHQRHGHGTIMLGMAEDYASGYGCPCAVTISAKDAVPFYTHCGYELYDWDPSQQFEHGKQMRKLLTKN